MSYLDLEARGYVFEVGQHQASVRARIDPKLGGYKCVFFDSWSSPRSLEFGWRRALEEATAHFVMRRLAE